MRPDDVRVGETYRVHVSRRADAAQCLTGDPRRAEADLVLLSWLLGGAEDFELTVTATGERLCGEPAVTGIRVDESSAVSTPLPPETAERLGLSRSVDYLVRGVLVDAATGRVVSLPTQQTVTIPARWLVPLSSSGKPA
ncbi:hypothetical protein [Gandjariella thermophila]|uniref:Uncharacterized protein n=1 Tax=Gandjariella thermophila TaxID=1931992 RepID=A0A4D4JBC5_9PSEU|nr:hypothetical protein [Gandjariella thermophila]GDY31143.1 hypothetical protein GTS_27760 [Gandjariella thermophila]